MRVRLDLGYDGTDFSGWARQRDRRTVEGVLDQALAMVLRLPRPPRLTVAGRTDAGVHARGQVAHTDLPAEVWAAHTERLIPSLRGVLPDDVRVTSAQRVPDVFDARFGALSRRYSYRLSDAASGVDPTRRHDTAWHRRPLNVARMNEGAALLVGEHDFVAFCKRREGASTVRTLQTLAWDRKADGVLEVTVVADAFCHNMVRSLVGACVAVGEGKRAASWTAEILASTERSSAVPVMPPHGLTLQEVQYPTDHELSRQASKARRFRG
ncbi:MAG: tRNA pseudouridine(38-40) synthase TruA [Actinomycetes bacterium]